MQYQGKISEWNDERGFGFITPDDGEKKVFVHIKSLTNRRKRPLVNDIVIYNLKTDSKGRFQADNVSYCIKSVQVNNYLLKNIFFVFLVVGFLAFITIAMFQKKLPFMVFSYYLVISGIAFFSYSLDKAAAENNEWRITEETLHVLSVVGGWPGALIAQVLIRHKSKKQSFRSVFWATVALNCLFLSVLFTDAGSHFVRVTLGFV